MALTHRISIVLGGAGTGKSTLIQAIVENWSSKTSDFILCAPTGKAAQNLRERLQLPAYTVHGALGKLPGESFLSDEKWEGISLIIVDEASMLTLEMLAGLLCKATRHCHMVLLGDPNQLLSLGAGNVLQDLQRIGVPGICLNKPYRQRNAEKALYHNIAHFPNIASIDDLHFDDSFLLWVAPEERIPEIICDEAAKMYRSGESVQVLSHFNKATDYSVAALNDGLKKMVNQDGRQNLILQYGGMTYYHGDRVMITSNDSQRGCYNGDIGRLQIHSDGPCGKTGFTVVMQHGRTATWTDASALKGITLAYALTVHKSQGSQYDTVFLPVSESLPNMMHRNLLYTAISRARERVILVGERQGLAKAMLRRPRGRRSGLLERIGMKLCERAS